MLMRQLHPFASGMNKEKRSPSQSFVRLCHLEYLAKQHAVCVVNALGFRKQCGATGADVQRVTARASDPRPLNVCFRGVIH